MKVFYDRQVCDFIFIEGQKVWVFIFKIYKGLFKKFFYNYYGLYRVVEKFSLVYYCLCICGNKLVSMIVYVNWMKYFVDFNDRLIIFLEDIVESELFLYFDDLFVDSFVFLEVFFLGENFIQGEEMFY